MIKILLTFTTGDIANTTTQHYFFMETEDLLQSQELFDDDENLALPTEQLYERFSCTVDKGQSPLRIDKYLFNVMGGTSRTRIQNAAEAGFVLVNGKAVNPNYKVAPLDLIQVMLNQEPNDYRIEPENIPIDIVYEDDDLIVVNKPANMVVHPGFGNYSGTLLNAIAYHLNCGGYENMNDSNIGLVHRIDKDTSGLLVVAKNADAKQRLAKQFFDKTTVRTYNALVWGTFTEQEGTIEGALARDNHDRLIFRVWDPEENPNAKHAVTHYRVLEQYAYTSLVECRLETGRTHQIRVHMKHIGHPLFADEKYGGMEIIRGQQTQKYRQFIKNCFEICHRQALHAKTLGFRHPRTGEEMFFDSSWPIDFTALIEKWRRFQI